ncbi:phage portal protein [Clostridium beijerinckii]|uniref:phage portal protein n=1 Tax=Clostridium beijerinckii TaxID=1520 RepID=UPI001F43DBE0|nr:phage portal protein [Clostridium beijerinckii]
MFLNTVKEFIKKVINSMFNKGTIEQQMNVDVAISNAMVDAIDLWTNIYTNNSPWVDKKNVFSMNLGVGIASEFAKLVTIEFKSEISNNDFLNEEYQAVINDIRNTVEYAAAKGGIVFKPYISNGHIEVDIVQADNFYPTAYNSRKEITGCILPETKVVGDYTYTRIEYHNFDNGTYTIINKAFKKKNYNNVNLSLDASLGQEVLLAEVPEWSELVPQIIFQNVERPLFSYFKMPLANRIDTASPLGVSVFDRVADDQGGLLRKADEMYSRTLWEYEAKEAAVHASRDLFKKDSEGKAILPTGKERLYRDLDIDVKDEVKKAIDVFSPEIRDTALFNGLNQLLRKIEFLVGLAYGTLSDVTDVAKTATEIEKSNQRSYQTVKDISNNLKVALKSLIYAMSYYGQVAKLPVKPVDLDKDVSYDFDDSIMVDRSSELQSMQTDVSLGIIKKKYYIMEKYKVDEKKALEMMEGDTTAGTDPYVNTEE